jgi:hypothetical protein
LLRTTLRRAAGFRTVTPHGGVTLSYRFSARGPVGSYSCKRDGRPWRSCHSPQRFFAPIGRHVFRVRAIGSEGEKGPIAVDRVRVTHSAR